MKFIYSFFIYKMNPKVKIIVKGNDDIFEEEMRSINATYML